VISSWDVALAPRRYPRKHHVDAMVPDRRRNIDYLSTPEKL